MRVIDARSGKDAEIGKRINYPAGEWVELVAVNRPSIWSVALVWRTPDSGAKGVTARLPVRYMHPSFPFQRVVFLPT
jgi:hypothetical protein